MDELREAARAAANAAAEEYGDGAWGPSEELADAVLAVLLDGAQEWGFDSPAQKGVMYVTRNVLLAETMAKAAPPGYPLKTRVAGDWNEA